MQDSDIPTKIPLAWANSAAGSYLTYPVPTPSQIGITNGAASFTDGFPPDCFLPYASGGAGPFGKDFNGVLKQLTAGLQWAQAGGPWIYDATFQTAIGGYANGAIVMSATTPGKYWLSTADNNTTNPDTGGANWVQFAAVPTSSSTGAFTLASPQTLSNATTTQIDLSGSALAFATVAAGGTVTITETGLYALNLNDTGQLTITGTASYGLISQIIVGAATVAQPWFEGYDSNTTHSAGNSCAATLYIASGTTLSATAFLGNSGFGGFSALSVQTASLTITKLG